MINVNKRLGLRLEYTVTTWIELVPRV